MAYDARIPALFQYKPAQQDERTYLDMLRAASQMKNANREAADTSRASRQLYDSNQIRLDEDQTLHPAVLVALKQKAQEMMSQGQSSQNVQAAPQSASGLPPYIAATVQQQPQDPYAAQQSILDERRAQLEDENRNSLIYSKVPVLAAMQKAKQANLAGREDLASDQFGINQNRAFAQAVPELEVAKNIGLREMRGAPTARSIDAYNKMVGAVQSAVVSKYPHLLNSKAYQDYMRDLEKFKPTPQPNMGVISMQPPSASVLDSAAKRIANRESTVSEEINKGRFAGAQAMQIHDDLVQRVKAIDPAFSETDTEGGYKFATNPATKRALTQFDNAYSTIARLKSVYAKLDNGQFPTLNKAINAGKVATGDVNAARAAIAEVLGNDELTQAFSRGGVGSDKLRDMSAALANYNYSPKQMAAQFDELLHGLKRSRNAYSAQGGGYIRDMKEPAPEEGAPAKPASKAEFDALPSGALWIDSKGETHRKK